LTALPKPHRTLQKLAASDSITSSYQLFGETKSSAACYTGYSSCSDDSRCSGAEEQTIAKRVVGEDCCELLQFC
jgi:hypothetical protein